MKKLLLLISLLLGLGVFLGIGRTAYAVDLTVTCNTNGPCSISPSPAPLFNENNWVPGDSANRQITVINQDPTQSCNLTLDTSNEVQSPSNFATVLGSAIYDSSSIYSIGLLNSVFTGGPISLGTVPANSTHVYNWLVLFNPEAGNEFQAASTTFDFNLNFTCDGPTPTPTAVPTTPPTSNPGGGSVQGASAPVCTSTVPSSAPFLSVNRAGANSATLKWTPVSPVNHYMIRYGTTPGDYIYGAPNVGNVTSFTVNLLSSGTTYYFQVAGVNDCMPGPWSNEASTRPTGVVLPAGPAVGFVPGTLGASTEATPTPTGSPEPTSTPQGQVESAATCSDPYYPWWLPLLLELVILMIYYAFLRIRKNQPNWWVVPVVIGLISQVIHQILGCNCATGELCPWYWVLNLIMLILFVVTRQFEERRNKSSK